MAVRGKIAASDATGDDLVGPQEFQDDCIIINRGPNRAYATANGDEAVDDTGMNFEVNEAVNTKSLPAEFKKGNWKMVCAAGETASVYWAFE